MEKMKFSYSNVPNKIKQTKIELSAFKIASEKYIIN